MRQPIRIGVIDAFQIPGVGHHRIARDAVLAIKDPETELVEIEAEDSFLPFVEQTYETELMAIQDAREAWKAERAGGLDALCIGCNTEPGVKAARELCDILVMGAAGAVQHVASMLGRRFSYVISGREGEGESSVAHSREMILSAAEHYGLSHKLASIRTVAVPPTGFNEALLSDAEFAQLQEAALSEAKKAIFEDGADVIIGYGGDRLHDFLVDQLTALGVPVLSTDQTLVKVTEMLVRLGLAQSKRTYPKPRRIYDFTIENVTFVTSNQSR